MPPIIDLSGSSPTQDSPRRPSKRSSPRRIPRALTSKNAYASEIIPLSDSEESEPDTLPQGLVNSGRPKRARFECTQSRWLWEGIFDHPLRLFLSPIRKPSCWPLQVCSHRDNAICSLSQHCFPTTRSSFAECGDGVCLQRMSLYRRLIVPETDAE